MTVKWAILGAGRISNDFVKALLTESAQNEVVAVAARDLTRAQEFAKLHGIPKAYGDYETLAKDPHIDVVYVGNVITQHFESTKLLLENNKHVICEKPLTINAKQTEQLIELAKSKKRFLMEAIWSRCFPVYDRLKSLLDSDTIGEIKYVEVTFGKPLEHKERMVAKELGGGTILDLGVYCLQFSQFVYKGIKPEKVIASGHLNTHGTDSAASAILTYPGGITTFSTSAVVDLPNEAIVVGTKGMLKIPDFWQPTKLITPSGIEEFPLPASPFNSERAAGMCYEVNEVNKCIAAGLLESPRIPHEESLFLARLMDDIRQQVGVVFKEDLQQII